MQINTFDFNTGVNLENNLIFQRKVNIDFTFIISAYHLRVREMMRMRIEAPHFHTLMMKYVMLWFERWDKGDTLNILNRKLPCRCYSWFYKLLFCFVLFQVRNLLNVTFVGNISLRWEYFYLLLIIGNLKASVYFYYR